MTGRGLLGALLVASATGNAWAETSASASAAGENASALTGVHRVGIALPKEDLHPRLAATLGYGFTEAQAERDSSHQRASAALAGALSPLSWLDLGLRVDGRYDKHPGDADGGDGTVLDSHLTARVSTLLSPHTYLGGELVGWLPGSEDAETSLTGTSVDARGLFGWHTPASSVGALLGFRLDRSEAAGKNADRLLPGDRLALGLSQYNSVLLGLGAVHRLGKSELLVEATADWLLGAPNFLESPLRVAGGARHRLGAGFSIEMLVEAALSSRPGLEQGAPLIPIEPRLSLLVGLRFGPVRRAAKTVAPVALPPPVPATRPVAASVALEITVTRPDGSAVTDAELTLTVNGKSQALTGDGAGVYRLEAAPVGKATLQILAPGLQPTTKELELESGSPAKLRIAPEVAMPLGQVRGLVRSFGSVGLAARVEIEPLGVTAQADAQGFFQVDAPPGEYTLVISVPGYVTQRRAVIVQKNGVVVINADLAKEK